MGGEEGGEEGGEQGGEEGGDEGREDGGEGGDNNRSTAGYGIPDSLILWALFVLFPQARVRMWLPHC